MPKRKIIYVGEDKIFAKTLKTTFFGTFWALWAHLNLYSKTRICQFSYFPMSNLWKKESTVGVQLVFTQHRPMDFQLEYSGTFLWGLFCWNYLFHKAWYKQKLQSIQESINLEQRQQRWQQSKTGINFYGITAP